MIDQRKAGPIDLGIQADQKIASLNVVVVADTDLRHDPALELLDCLAVVLDPGI